MNASRIVTLGMCLALVPLTARGTPSKSKRQRVDALAQELANAILHPTAAAGFGAFGEAVRGAVGGFLTEWKLVGDLAPAETAGYTRGRRSRGGLVGGEGGGPPGIAVLKTRAGGTAATSRSLDGGVGTLSQLLTLDAKLGRVNLRVDDGGFLPYEVRGQLLPKLFGVIPMAMVHATVTVRQTTRRTAERSPDLPVVVRTSPVPERDGSYAYTLHLGTQGKVRIPMPAIVGRLAFKR